MPNLIGTQIKLQVLLLRMGLVAVVALAVFSSGVFFGGALEKSSWQKKALQAAEVSTKIIRAKEGETQQCRAEIEKYNQATAVIQEQIKADLIAAAEARAQAAEEARARAKESNIKAQRVLIALQEIKEGVDNGKFDPCTNTIADSNFIGLLNDALATNRGGNTGSDGDLPGSGAGD